jgi:hypothetical protein
LAANHRKVSPEIIAVRVSISSALAAPFLRKLNMDSFALNWFGQTSEGKTFLLKAGASVAGLIGPGGLPGWADTEAAFEGNRILAKQFDLSLLALALLVEVWGGTVPVHKPSVLFVKIILIHLLKFNGLVQSHAHTMFYHQLCEPPPVNQDHAFSQMTRVFNCLTRKFGGGNKHTFRCAHSHQTTHEVLHRRSSD